MFTFETALSGHLVCMNIEKGFDNHGISQAHFLCPIAPVFCFFKNRNHLNRFTAFAGPPVN